LTLFGLGVGQTQQSQAQILQAGDLGLPITQLVGNSKGLLIMLDSERDIIRASTLPIATPPPLAATLRSWAAAPLPLSCAAEDSEVSER
jgi:hypothetical protein